MRWLMFVALENQTYLLLLLATRAAWGDIKEELERGQVSADRHDLTATVFKQKLTKFIDIITKCHVFGETQCWICTVEWQKRGLPHAHLLVWLKTKVHANQIDYIIAAEIPNIQEDCLLHSVVT